VPAAAIDDVHEDDDYIREDTPEERWQNSLRNVAGNAIALSAYWNEPVYEQSRATGFV
jgi:hypothetical protein